MRRRAFTLVEVMIGSAVLAVLAIGVFRVFGSANKANVQALWYTNRQAQAREMLNMLRNDLSKAACPSHVTETGVDRGDWSNDAYFLKVKSGETDLTGGDTELLRWVIATPHVEVNDPTMDKAATLSTCVLSSRGTTLHYSRQGTAGPNYEKDMVEDVVKVTLEFRAATDGLATTYDEFGHVVEIQLDLKHSNPQLFPNAHLTEKTTARTQVPTGAL